MAMPRFDGGDVVDHRARRCRCVPEVTVSSPEMHAQQRRLAAARRADEDDELARLDVEVDVLEDVDGAVALERLVILRVDTRPS